MVDFIWETSDINYVSYLLTLGYKISNIRNKMNETINKNVVSFVFYENPNVINNMLKDYICSDIAKHVHYKNELTTLIRKTSSLTKEELLEKINGS